MPENPEVARLAEKLERKAREQAEFQRMDRLAAMLTVAAEAVQKMSELGATSTDVPRNLHFVATELEKRELLDE